MSDTPKYVAIINTPGYMPWSDDDDLTFDSARDAWEYLADERARQEDCAEAWGDEDTTRADLLDAAATNECGVIYGPTPGYEGDHDLGIAYSVDVAEEEYPEESRTAIPDDPADARCP